MSLFCLNTLSPSDFSLFVEEGRGLSEQVDNDLSNIYIYI